MATDRLERIKRLRRIQQLRNQGRGPGQMNAQLQAFSDADKSAPGAGVKAALDFAQSVPVAGPLLRGFRNTAQGITQLGMKGAEALGVVDPETVDTYDRASQDSQEKYKQTWAGQIPGSTLPGEALSMLAAPIGRGATTVAGKIGSGTAEGAAFGATRPVERGKDFKTEKLLQTGVGAAGGGAGAGLLAGVQRLKKGKADPDRDASRGLLEDSGVRLTPGQKSNGLLKTAEDQSTGILGVGSVVNAARGRAMDDFQRAAYDRALGPIGQSYPKSGPVGYEGIAAVDRSLQKAYNEVLPKMQATIDSGFGSTVQGIGQRIADEMPDKAANRFMADLKNFFPKNQMSGQELKKAQSLISERIRQYERSPNIAEQDMAKHWIGVKSAFDDMLMRQNPDQAPQLAAVNEGWANYVRLNDAAGRAGSKNGVMTPNTLKQAVRSNTTDKSKRGKGKGLLQDLADAGDNILGNSVGDSGTAGRNLLTGLLYGPGAAGLTPLVEPTTAAALMASTFPYTAPRMAGALGKGAAFVTGRGAPAAGLGLLESHR